MDKYTFNVDFIKFVKKECPLFHGSQYCTSNEHISIGLCQFAKFQSREICNKESFIVGCKTTPFQCMVIYLKWFNAFDTHWDIAIEHIRPNEYALEFLDKFFPDKKDIWETDLIVMKSMKD